MAAERRTEKKRQLVHDLVLQRQHCLISAHGYDLLTVGQCISVQPETDPMIPLTWCQDRLKEPSKQFLDKGQHKCLKSDKAAPFCRSERSFSLSVCYDRFEILDLGTGPRSRQD